MEKGIYSLLTRQKHALVERAGEAIEQGNNAVKADAEMRIRFLVRLREEMESLPGRVLKPTVFVSYSKNTGEPYFQIASEIADQHGFEVVTGFQARQSDNVLRAVLDAIGRSSLFLSIMTAEYRIERVDQTVESRAAPSVWVMEEKGMALALGKPFRLLVEDRVHPDFWRRTTPGKLHTMFAAHNFRSQASEGIRALYQRYDELLLRSFESGLEMSDRSPR